MSGALWIAAKAPRPGFAKTRLAAEIGDERALALYRAFLRDLAGRLAGLAPGWYVTPAGAWPELAPLVGPANGLPGNVCQAQGNAAGQAAPRVLAQGEGDWTERQQRLFRGAAGRGETTTVLIASDSPQLDPELVHEAFRLLERDRDLVLAPVEDGGYSLIGMRGSHDVLDGIPMSTGRVTDRILARARLLGLEASLLPMTFDVDEASDLDRLRACAGDLPATRAALAELFEAVA